MFLAVGQAYAIPTVALRYWQVYGQRQALSNPYTGSGGHLLLPHPGRQGAPDLRGRASSCVDFVHVSDIARANVLALEHAEANGRAINIGTGTPISILEVAWTLIREMGADKDGMEPDVLGQFRPGDTRDCYPDISLARALAGLRAPGHLPAGGGGAGGVGARSSRGRWRTASSRRSRSCASTAWPAPGA